MCGYLTSHGTNPNAFGGEFLWFDPNLFPDNDEIKQPKSGWLDIDDIGPDHTINAESPSADDAQDTLERLLALGILDTVDEPDDYLDDDPHGLFDRNGDDVYSGNGEHFVEMAKECGINYRGFDLYSLTGRAKIVVAWVAWRYDSYYDSDSPELRISTIRSSEYEDDAVLSDGCSRSGCNRMNHGMAGWWTLDQKDEKAYLGRRRGKGICRAPKWQKFAGGRRKARISLRSIPHAAFK